MTRRTDAIDHTNRPEPAGSGRFPSREDGLTMIELVVVIAVLVIVAGIAIARLEGTEEHAARRVTAATLRTVQGAILGTVDQPGYLTDVREMPTSIGDLFVVPEHLKGTALAEYDRIARRGWSGPYLQPTGATQLVVGSIGGSATKSPAVFDGWRNPLILQKPANPVNDGTPAHRYWRLVSRGPDGAIETNPNVAKVDPTNQDQVGDDIVLYLTWTPLEGS